jgi:hypothetical protein
MVVDVGMNGDQFLQTSHTAEPLHGSLPSSKRKVGILSPIVQPAASFLLVGIASFLHRLTLGLQLVGHQNMRAAAPLHLLYNFNGFSVPSICNDGFQHFTLLINCADIPVARFRYATRIVVLTRLISSRRQAKMRANSP